jgi:hypothetical protein
MGLKRQHVITYQIIDWYRGRFRAEVLVDGHCVEKAFFDSHADAVIWSVWKVSTRTEEVAGESR